MEIYRSTFAIVSSNFWADAKIRESNIHFSFLEYRATRESFGDDAISFPEAVQDLRQSSSRNLLGLCSNLMTQSPQVQNFFSLSNGCAAKHPRSKGSYLPPSYTLTFNHSGVFNLLEDSSRQCAIFLPLIVGASFRG